MRICRFIKTIPWDSVLLRRGIFDFFEIFSFYTAGFGLILIKLHRYVFLIGEYKFETKLNVC